MSGLNFEMILICGGFGGFLWIVLMFEFFKSISIENVCIGVIVEVEN